MTFTFICQMRCTGCGAMLESRSAGAAIHTERSPYLKVKDLAGERGWKQVGTIPGSRMWAYYCAACCNSIPEVIAKIAAKRLLGKEVGC